VLLTVEGVSINDVWLQERPKPFLDGLDALIYKQASNISLKGSIESFSYVRL
jgi:hypothetical protein